MIFGVDAPLHILAERGYAVVEVSLWLRRRT